jgi:hypothetical protein
MEVIGQLHASVALHQEKNAGTQFNRKVGKLQSWCGRFEEETILLPLPRFESRIVQPAA